jgi:hypothetical protein
MGFKLKEPGVDPGLRIYFNVKTSTVKVGSQDVQIPILSILGYGPHM